MRYQINFAPVMFRALQRLRRPAAIAFACALLSCDKGEGDDEKLQATYTGVLVGVRAALRDVAERHDFDVDGGPPEGWMTTPYLAGASSRPDIRQYFRNYLAYVGELETRLHVIADSVIDAHFARAGFDAATEAKLKGAFKRGFARTRENQTQMNAAMRKYAEDALRVHEFLASVDARVWPGVGNDLDFEDLKEQMQFATLIRTLERSETFLARAQDQAQVSTREAMRQAGVRP